LGADTGFILTAHRVRDSRKGRKAPRALPFGSLGETASVSSRSECGAAPLG